MTADGSSWLVGTTEMADRIRSHRWEETPLGPLGTWPQSLRTAVGMMLALPGPATLLMGADHIQLYNDAYIPIARDRHPAILARPVQEGWPDAYEAVIAPLLSKTAAGLAPQLTGVMVELASADGRPEERMFDTVFVPIRDEDGAIAGALQMLTESTDTDRVRAALQDSERRFRAFVNASSDVVYRMSADWSSMRELDGRGILADTPGPNDAWKSNYILPEDQAMVAAAIERAIAQRSTFELVHRVRQSDGGVGWTYSRATPILDDQGGIVEWLGAASDVTERKRGELALRDSEDRFRSFAETSTDTLWIVDANTGELEYLSPAFEEMWGDRRDTVMADLGRWADKLHPDDREKVAAALPRAIAGEAYTVEYRIRRAANSDVRWIRDAGFPIRNADGQVVRVGGIAQDITEEKEAARHADMLLAELQHRVRNILAVTRAIVRRSNDMERSNEDYVNHLDGRLAALARTQVLLTRKADASVALEDLLRDELHVQIADEGQIRLEGPEVDLSPKAAEVLTLAVHELATNAIKYGALSRPSGHLAIVWRVEERQGRSWLRLCWTETGVPIVDAAPRREGFGHELISHRIPYELKGHGSFELRPGGLHSCIEFPLSPGSSILQTSGAAA